MPLDPSFWDDAPVWCARCFDLHATELPHKCECGHVMKTENLHEVGIDDILIGRAHHRALTEIQAAEDARVFAMLDEIAAVSHAPA